MSQLKPPPKHPPSEPSDRMWPLDVSITALAGLVLYLIVTRLQFDDPRWLFNAWSYVIAVPTFALVLAFVSHGFVTRYIQKSIQLGFLFSVFVHLLLLILAINVIIFSRYFPDAFTGVKPERSPVRRTVPEYLFQTPEETAVTPDWSKPVEAETTSRVVPEEQRQLPPVEHSAPRLEVPRPEEPQQRPMQKFLMKREQPNESLPQPADSPAKLARRRTADAQATAQSPTAPDVPAQADVEAVSVERQTPSQQRSRQSATDLAAAAPAELRLRAPPQRSLSAARNRSTQMPMIGESGLRRERRERSTSGRMQPVGSAPAPQSVAVAHLVEVADRMIAQVAAPVTRQTQATGAQLTSGQSASPGLPTTDQQASSGAELARNTLAARSGVPDITAGRSQRAPGRARRQTSGFGSSPAGTPNPSESIPSVADGGENDIGDQIADRLGSELMSDRASRQSGGTRGPKLSSVSAAGPTLDLLLDDGPVGLSTVPNRTAGVIPSDDQPEIASLELTSGTRPRREVGGPSTPFGTRIAAVESFSRRVMRTRGGAAPTPAGRVGPATEEAIERGLAYLASVQNQDDGSWSLQGHGSEVLLRTDTAATGLCLLAFQGAGYTHRQHQYADTVSRALKFLLDNQRTNGDLYRKENTISDRNVALYSQGIAALAVCEAYGMTQDPELKEAAQASLDYIINTQHHQRGGWRYTPQVSADTSVSGWMMMALKSGQLSGLEVPDDTYEGIDHWLRLAQSPDRPDRYRYNPYAPDTPTQRHGKTPTPTMTAVGMLMRMYSGWRRDDRRMQTAADYLLEFPPQMGTPRSPQRDGYYWYYATQVMFHMGGDYWARWNRSLNPVLLGSQIKDGTYGGSWDPMQPVPDRWSLHGGRLYVTTMNLLNLEVYYRHLPIYEDSAD